MMNIPALKEIVDERKEKAIENLSTSYAKNKMPLEEYERLVEYINKIESERELVVVEKMVREYEASPVAEAAAEADAEKSKPAAYDDDYRSVYASSQPFSGSNLTILSSRVFSGPVKPGVQFLSILGSTQIKVRKADLEKKRSEINVVSIFGDSSIQIEPGIRVSVNAVPILGSVDTNQKVDKFAQSGESELIVSGAALFGNISVTLLKE
jgi:hypothetical protein